MKAAWCPLHRPNGLSQFWIPKNAYFKKVTKVRVSLRKLLSPGFEEIFLFQNNSKLVDLYKLPSLLSQSLPKKKTCFQGGVTSLHPTDLKFASTKKNNNRHWPSLMNPPGFPQKKTQTHPMWPSLFFHQGRTQPFRNQKQTKPKKNGEGRRFSGWDCCHCHQSIHPTWSSQVPTFNWFDGNDPLGKCLKNVPTGLED